MKRNLKLEELEVYKVAMEIGEAVWNVVVKWDYFQKKTLGAQLVDAADSIALNIAEGYGRFHYKDNKNFCYYSRGISKGNFNGTDKGKNKRSYCRRRIQITFGEIYFIFQTNVRLY